MLEDLCKPKMIGCRDGTLSVLKLGLTLNKIKHGPSFKLRRPDEIF